MTRRSEQSYSLGAMSENDKSGLQERDLRDLEVRVEELIRACSFLRDENKTLRAREHELEAELDRLASKNTQAKDRVAGLIERLKLLESEA